MIHSRKKKSKIGMLRFLKKMTFLPSKKYAKYSYEYFTGKKLDLDNPTEFNAKIHWYSVFFRPKILTQLVDKYEVRPYVKEKIGEEYLNELYGVYNSFSEIDLDLLPNEFIIKAVHSSSHNLIVKSKSKLNKKQARRKFKRWLRTNQYYRTGQEWAYKDVVPKIVVEKLLIEDGMRSLTDYKFYCFKGVAKFVEVHLDRAHEHKRGFWDLDFKKLPFRYVSLEDSIRHEIKKPDNFNEMITLSEKLADNFPFVRVDFYSVNGKSVFGEMTFYPSGGKKDFIPDEYNKIIGDYFELPKIPENQKVITQY